MRDDPVVSVRVPFELKERLAIRAYEERKTVTEVVREAIERHLTQLASGPLEAVMYEDLQVGWKRRALPILEDR